MAHGYSPVVLHGSRCSDSGRTEQWQWRWLMNMLLQHANECEALFNPLAVTQAPRAKHKPSGVITRYPRAASVPVSILCQIALPPHNLPRRSGTTMWQPKGGGVGKQRMRAVRTGKRPRRESGIQSIRNPVSAVPAGFTQSNMVNRALLDRRELKQRSVEALVQTRWAVPKIGTGQGEDERFCVAGTRAAGKGRATHATVVVEPSDVAAERILTTCAD